LPSSRFTLNTPDWKDATRALTAFAREWGGRIVVTMHPGGTQAHPILTIEAQLVMDFEEGTAPNVLGSARVSMPGRGVGDLCAVLLSLGYELDKDLYRRSEALQN